MAKAEEEKQSGEAWVPGFRGQKVDPEDYWENAILNGVKSVTKPSEAAQK